MQFSKILNISIVSIVICWIVTFAFWEDKAVHLVDEDWLVEWTQFFLFIFASVYCFLVIKGNHVYYDSTSILICFSIFLVLLIFVAGEEISWGQRIFGIQTPDFIKAINKQNEINVHNLKSIQRFRHWLLIGVGAVGLMTILRKDILEMTLGKFLQSILQPSGKLTLLFALILAGGIFVELADLLRFFTGDSLNAKRVRSIAGRSSEIAELFVAIVAFYYSASKYYDMRQGKWKIHEILNREVSQVPLKKDKME